MRICLLKIGSTLLSPECFDSATDALPFGESERTRLKAIKNKEVACQSLCSRIALARLCGGSAYGPIEKDENGKPYLAAVGAPQLSISHSEIVVAAALADACEGRIGIDVEPVRTDRNVISIAERFFSPDELSRFKACGGTHDAFYSLWTEKEARAKLFGDGLGFELSGNARGEKIYYYKYLIRIGNTRAILCAASEHRAEKINFIDLKDKDIEIYELQN